MARGVEEDVCARARGGEEGGEGQKRKVSSVVLPPPRAPPERESTHSRASNPCK